MLARFEQLTNDLKAVRAVFSQAGGTAANSLRSSASQSAASWSASRPATLRADKQYKKTWSRWLRSIGLGGPTYFAPLEPETKLAAFAPPEPETTLAASKRSKKAGILAGIVLAALATLGVGAAVVGQFTAVKIQITGLKNDVAGLREKLAKLEANVVAAPPLANEAKGGADARMPAIPVRTPPFSLTRDEIQLIRDFIKVPPAPPGAARNINVGDILPDTALAPLPDQIMEKLPKLRGARFTVDRNGAIVVVAPGTNRVDVIIDPS